MKERWKRIEERKIARVLMAKQRLSMVRSVVVVWSYDDFGEGHAAWVVMRTGSLLQNRSSEETLLPFSMNAMLCTKEIERNDKSRLTWL